jgi:rhodanese-related sulfurtransferase
MTPISYTEIRRMQAEGQKVICVDVRDAWQQRNNSAGGYSAPYNAIAAHISTLSGYKNGTIVLCAMKPHGRCEKTKLAASALSKYGFETLYELRDGIMQGWIQPLGAREKMPGAN